MRDLLDSAVGRPTESVTTKGANMNVQTAGVLRGHFADGLGHTQPAESCRCRGDRRPVSGGPDWTPNPETGRVAIVDLMDAADVDDSGSLADRADGATDGGRTLKATEPWAPSLVRLGQRPRVRRAVASEKERARLERIVASASVKTAKGRARKAAALKALKNVGADAKLARLLASYGVDGPTVRPDMFGPCIKPTEGPAADLIGRPVKVVDIGAHVERYIVRRDGIETTMVRVGDGWEEATGTDAETLAVTDLPDTFVPMGRNADIEGMANALLAADGFFDTAE